MASTLQVAEIPLGQTGLSGSRNQSQVPITALIDATSITYESGTIRKEGGATKYNSTAITGGPDVIAGWDWIHDGSTQRMIVVTSAGDILKDSGAATFPVTLKSGLTVANTLPTFCEAGKEAAANNRKLFIFTGQNAVQVLSADAATTSDLTTPAADWTGTGHPTFGAVHEARLWCGGNSSDPHRMYYSTLTDHEDFTGAGSGSISVFSGQGEKLVGALSYKGGLIVAKTNGIYFIDTSATSTSSWRVFPVSTAIGAAGLACYAAMENDAMYLDRNGDIRQLSATQEYGNVGTQSLSDFNNISQFMRDTLNMNTLKDWRFCYYKTKRQLHIACMQAGSSTLDARLIMDFSVNGIVRTAYSPRDACLSMWTRQNNGKEELMIGDGDGFVWRIDQESRSNAGTGYNGQFKTPHTDLSYIDPRLSTMRKNGRFLEIVTEPVGNWNLSVDVYWDGEYSQTVQFNMGATGAALGSFTLGTDRLSGNQVLNRKRRITGGGRRISIVGRNSGDGQDFSIARIFLHFAVGDERLEA